MWVGMEGVVRDGVSRLLVVLIGWVGDIQPSLCGVPGPRVGVVGEGFTWANGGSKVSEFWRVVGGLQLVVARDGGSAGRVGGAGGGTDRGAVLGSGEAKEVAEPGGVLAVR